VSIPARARRRSELALMLMAGLITVGAYVLVALGRTASLPADLLPFFGQLLGLLAITHVATRWLAPRADPTLVPLAALLNGIGFVVIARLSNRLASLQATWTLVGVAAFVGTLLLVRDVERLARLKWTFALGGVLLLLLPFVPHIGRNINGSRIWIRVGTLSFQPGEIAKVTLAIFLAGYLAERRALLSVATWRVGPLRLPEPRHIGPLVAAWALSVAIMVGQRDLGSSILFLALFVTLMWLATAKLSYPAIAGVLFAGAAYFAYRLRFGQVFTRVSIWLNPWADAQGKGYQLVQSAFSFAAGGVTGTGFGLGSPTRIPEVRNDFIFVAIAEELGLLGSAAVLIAFMLFVGSGLRVAVHAERVFSKLLAAGLTTIVGVQAFVIIGGVVRAVPLTGVTLPFVSYGGSSLVANYVLLALLVRISDSAGANQVSP
jgi:cell division protein FtsW (lipid II flippase)